MPNVPSLKIFALAAATATVTSIVFGGAGFPPLKGRQTYEDGLAAWRKHQTEALLADDGWLDVTGLAWLTEGDTTIGSSSDAKLVLPAYAPKSLGTLSLSKGRVTLNVSPDARVEVDGKPVTTVEMKSDSVRAVAGSITLMVIQRGKRIGLRMFDKNSKARREFTGQKWFPPNKILRVSAKLIPYDPPHTITIFNVIGDATEVKCPGYLSFKVDGKECRLDVQPQGNGYFLNFTDTTSGQETYPAGRFLDVPRAANGSVVIDFNEAVNPPCAFTEFATCPLPPANNRLKVAIPAGEKNYHDANVDPELLKRARKKVPPR